MAIAENTGQRITNGGPASTSSTFTFPTAPSAGDLVIFCLSWRGGATITGVPFSCILAQDGGHASTQIDSSIYYKVADGTEGTTWTFTLSGSFKSAGCATTYSGSFSSPKDVSNSNGATSGTTGLSTGSTGTLSNAVSLAVALWSCNTNATWSAHSSGFTEILESSSTGGATSTRNTTSMATLITSSTTALNPTATLSASNEWSSAIAVFYEDLLAPPAGDIIRRHRVRIICT